MADIFDKINPQGYNPISSAPKKDIFDQINPSSAQAPGDIFDKINPKGSTPPDALTRLEDSGGWGMFTNPLDIITGKSLNQMSNEDAAVPATSRPFDRNIIPAEASQNLAIGGDALLSPLSYTPVPAAEVAGPLLGSILQRFAPKAAKYLAERMPSMAPEWNKELTPPPPISTSVPTPTADVTPVAPAATPVDQSADYQNWLQKNAQPATPQNPIMNVPLHPAEDVQAALAQIPEELPGQNGQLGFRGFPQAPEAPPLPANTPDYMAAIEKYQASLQRPQGQQEFDFTQGPQPTTPEVSTPAAPVAPPVQAAFPTSSPTPAWLKESLAQIEKERGIPKTPFIEQDLNNPSVVKAIKLDPSLNEVQKSAILNIRTGGSLDDVLGKPPINEGVAGAPRMRLGTGRQMVLKDVLNKSTEGAAPEGALVAPEEPAHPFPESSNQQKFDFPAELQKNPLDRLSKVELQRRILTAPDAEIPMIRQRIEDLNVPDRSAGIIKEPLAATPVTEAPVLTKAAKAPKMTPEETALRARRLELFNKADDLSPQEETELGVINRKLTAKKPTPLEDIQTIAKGLNKRIGEKGAIGDLGEKVPMTPEERAAIDRWKTTHGPEILSQFNARAGSAADWVAEKYPNVSPVEKALMIHGIRELKAGNKIENFNLKQYPEEQQKQIRELFKGQEDKLKTKTITHADTVARAKELTVHPITEAIGRNAEGQLPAELVDKEMTHVAKMKALAEDPTLSSTDMVKKMAKMDVGSVKKIRTELGRGLNAANISVEANTEKLAAYRKIMERIRTDPTLTKASSRELMGQLKTQFPEAKNATTVAQVFKEIYRNSITSSPVTWGINAISNYGNIAARTPMRIMEITADKAIGLLSKTPTTSTYKEVGAMLKGMKDALQGAKLPDHLKSKTFTESYKSSPLDILAANAKTEGGQKALDATSKVIHTPSTIMQMADEHAKNIMGMMEMEASKARGEDIFNDQRAIERITGSQARGSFQDEMSEIGKFVAHGRNYFSHQEPTAFNQAGDMFTYALQPFIQTVDRIIAKGINTSILGAVKMGAQGAGTLVGKGLEKVGAKGFGAKVADTFTGDYKGAATKGLGYDPVAREKLTRDMAAVMVGAPLMAWTWSQFAKGNIQGAAPQDTAGRNAFNNSGKQEYSIKMGNRWVPLRYAPEPAATAIQINLALLQGGVEAKQKGQDLSTAIFNGVKNVGYMLGTKQYLGGMNSLMNAVNSKESEDVNDPTDSGNFLNRNPVVKKIVSSVAVPSFVKDAGVVANTLRNKPRVVAETTMEAIRRRSSFTDGMVPEVNTFGEAVTHPMEGKVNNDPAYALAEKFPPPAVNRTIEGVKLTEQQYHDVSVSVGQQMKRVYGIMANNPAFMKAPQGLQQLVSEGLASAATEVGTLPEKMREMKSDPLYYDREMRILLDIKKPGGERHFPYLK